MSHAHAVRQSLALREQSNRTLDQRFAIRFPRLATAYARLILGLPPTSRVRQAAVARMARSAVEAYNRADLAPFLISFHPQAEYEVAAEMAGLGITASNFTVHDSLRQYWEEGRTVWPELRVEPREVIDLGDHVLMLGTIGGQGFRSGTQTSYPYATVATVSNGRIVRLRE